MVSSVGHDVVTACASMRCGLSRPGPLEFSVFDDEALEEVPVAGHPLAGLTEGYVGLGLFARIGGAAVKDLITYAGLENCPARFWERTGLFIALSPQPSPLLTGFDAIVVDDLPPLLLPQAGIGPDLGHRAVLLRGHVGGLLAIDRAHAAIRQRKIDRALIVGIDSLVQTEALETLAEQGRLKTPVQPVGLMPGEAGAAILLEPPATARARQARIEGFLHPVLRGTAGQNADPFKRGQTLARLIISAARAWGPPKTTYVDLNGEEPRAEAWGYALTQASGQVDTNGLEWVLPAESLGDVGAAYATVAIAAAVQAFVQGDSPGSSTWVTAMSDDGETGLAVVERATSSR